MLPLLLVRLLLITGSASLYAYNRPGCVSWPKEETWASELEDVLSPHSVLHGPFDDDDDYSRTCESIAGYSDDRVIQGGGICMMFDACS